MKTTWINKLGLAVLVMLVMGYASAIEPEIRITGAKKFILKMDNVTENTNLVIREMNGNAIYSETIEKSNKAYSKMFDLSMFEDGNYAVELEGPFQMVSFEFNIVADKLSKTTMPKTEIYKPTLFERGKKVYISKYNPNNSYLNITIFDEDDNVVYEERLAGKNGLKRIYDFSKVKGDYRISMSSDNKTYNQIVSVNE